MERTLQTKRIYALGQYQNIEFTDKIEGISGDVLTTDLAYKVQLLQILGMERMINKYLIIKGNVGNMSPEEAIKLIEEERTELIADMRTVLPENAKQNIEIKEGD